MEIMRGYLVYLGSLIFIIFIPVIGVFGQAQSNGLIIKSIYFGGGSYDVSIDQSNELVAFIKNIPDLEHYQVVIFSHTDNIGGKEYNQWLSEMRSGEVYKIVIDIPIPKEKIELKDFGQERPLYQNDANLGRRANRRVDVILVPIVF